MSCYVVSFSYELTCDTGDRKVYIYQSGGGGGCHSTYWLKIERYTANRVEVGEGCHSTYWLEIERYTANRVEVGGCHSIYWLEIERYTANRVEVGGVTLHTGWR